MIMPTVGRIVHFIALNDRMHPSEFDPLAPLAAIITWVFNDHMVNLRVFDAVGGAEGRQSVPFVQPGETPPDRSYCCWMPYQVKKSHGSESGEPAAGTETI